MIGAIAVGLTGCAQPAPSPSAAATPTSVSRPRATGKLPSRFLGPQPTVMPDGTPTWEACSDAVEAGSSAQEADTPMPDPRPMVSTRAGIGVAVVFASSSWSAAERRAMVLCMDAPGDGARLVATGKHAIEVDDRETFTADLRLRHGGWSALAGHYASSTGPLPGSVEVTLSSGATVDAPVDGFAWSPTAAWVGPEPTYWVAIWEGDATPVSMRVRDGLRRVREVKLPPIP
jgi:hypothetical protein